MRTPSLIRRRIETEAAFGETRRERGGRAAVSVQQILLGDGPAGLQYEELIVPVSADQLLQNQVAAGDVFGFPVDEPGGLLRKGKEIRVVAVVGPRINDGNLSVGIKPEAKDSFPFFLPVFFSRESRIPGMVISSSRLSVRYMHPGVFRFAAGISLTVSSMVMQSSIRGMTMVLSDTTFFHEPPQNPMATRMVSNSSGIS